MLTGQQEKKNTYGAGYRVTKNSPFKTPPQPLTHPPRKVCGPKAKFVLMHFSLLFVEFSTKSTQIIFETRPLHGRVFCKAKYTGCKSKTQPYCTTYLPSFMKYRILKSLGLKACLLSKVGMTIRKLNIGSAGTIHRNWILAFWQNWICRLCFESAYGNIENLYKVWIEMDEQTRGENWNQCENLHKIISPFQRIYFRWIKL